MKSDDDLPFLRAQAAELERLIAIAPPSAVIARFQYEERLKDVQALISSVEQSPVSIQMESPIDESDSNSQRFPIAGKLDPGVSVGDKSIAGLAGTIAAAIMPALISSLGSFLIGGVVVGSKFLLDESKKAEKK